MKRLIILFLLIATTTLANWQHTVYAGYFYYFAKHTQFEAHKNLHDFKIATIGSVDMFQAARHMSLSKDVSGRRISVEQKNNINECEGYHIIFLDKSKSSSLKSAVDYCEKNNILLVTDIAGASKKGADIELWEDSDSNVRFTINGPACKESHLKLSAVLFNMSKTH